MSAGLSRGWRKGVRTVAQVIAGGALTALVTAIADGLEPATQGIVMGAWVAVLAFAQNWAEGAGKIGVLLPTPSLIPGPTSDAVATVEAVADEAGGIAGDVIDPAGDVVGEVVGQLPDKDGDQGGGAGLVALLVVVFLALLAVGGYAVMALLEPADEAPRTELSV